MGAEVVTLSLKVAGQINNMLLFDELKRSNQACIKKLDKLEEKVDSAILMDLKAAQKCFEDFQKADAFTKSNVEFLKNTFRKYQGLSLKGKTAGVSNKTIVANAYLGLIVLEGTSAEKNDVLIARYIFHIFEADPSLAKKCFPEIHESYFVSKCAKTIKQSQQDMDFVRNAKNCGFGFYEKNIRDKIPHLIELMSKYKVSFYISDWTEGATTIKGKLAGKVANKVIGPLKVDASNVLEKIALIDVLNLSPFGSYRETVISIFCKILLIKLEITIPIYTEKTLIPKTVQKAAGEYLKKIDTRSLPASSKKPKKK